MSKNRLRERATARRATTRDDGEHFITYNGRQIRCPHRDPVKIAAWLKERRNDPSLWVQDIRDRMSARLEAAERKLRRVR